MRNRFSPTTPAHPTHHRRPTQRRRGAMAAAGVLVAGLLVAGCGGRASFTRTAGAYQGASVAVVSVSINDFGGSLQGWNQTITSDLMYTRATSMLQMAEAELARHFRVVPAPQFIGNPHYQQLAPEPFEVAVPSVGEHYMPVFADERGQLVRAQVSPGMAQALAQVTGTDLVAVVYSEWGVATGGFVPTSKALSKNVVGLFDASGREVFRKRVDRRGRKTLGAFGRVVVDENSIDEWVEAYREGLELIFDS
jgi:hypothetical protein